MLVWLGSTRFLPKKGRKRCVCFFGGERNCNQNMGGVGWVLFRKAFFFEVQKTKEVRFSFFWGRSFTWRYLGNHSTREFLNETFWNPLLAVGSWWWSKSRPRGGIFLQKLGKDDVINRYLLCLVVEFCEFSGNVMFVLGVFLPLPPPGRTKSTEPNQNESVETSMFQYNTQFW